MAASGSKRIGLEVEAYYRNRTMELMFAGYLAQVMAKKYVKNSKVSCSFAFQHPHVIRKRER